MRLIIVSSGHTIWSDLEQLGFPENPPDADIMAVNDAIMHVPHIDHAYSNDFEMLMNWVRARRPMYNKNFRKHCCFPCEGAELRKIKVHGNSGICAVYAGLELGYDEIIVCGTPQDNEGHYFDPPWVRTNYGKSVKKRPGSDQIRYWSNLQKGKVFSMSGRTEEVLGRPKWAQCRKEPTPL